MRLRTVGSKLFLGMGAVILSFILLCLLITAQLTGKFAEEEVLKNLQQGKKSFDRLVSLRQRLLVDKAGAVAEAPYLKATMNIAEVDHETVLVAIQNVAEVAEAALLLLTDVQGQLLADANDASLFGTDLRKFPGIEAALRGEETFTFWSYRGRFFLAAVVPVIAGGQILGVLAVGDGVDSFFADDIRQVTGRDVVIISSGKLLADSSAEKTSLAPTREERSRLLASVERLARESEGANFPIELGGKARLATAIPVKGTSMIIVLSRALEELTALSRRTWVWLLVAGIPTAGLAVVVSRLIANRLSRPIQDLMKASKAMAGGDLTVSVKKRGDDEIGMLSASFNSMAEKIAALVRDVRSSCEKAEIANAAKSEFMENMSHELRTPLHGILSFADFGVGKHDIADRKKLRKYFERIQGSGQILLGLVNDLLELAKLESGKVNLKLQPTDLTDLMAAAVDEFEPLLSERNLVVHQKKPKLKAEILVDPEKIKLVFRNLLSNALKFSPEAGTIEIVLREDKDSLVFSIRDGGPGVPENELEAVFEKFVQSSRTKTGAGGTGLGLAICARIIADHEGRIWAENNPDGGATFWFSIPLRVDEHAAQEPVLLRSDVTAG